MHNHDECPYASDLPAFLQGELSQEARASLEQHLKDCPACRAAAESHRRTIETLRRPLPPVESRDLAPAILERVQAGNRGRRPVFLRAAALVIGLVGAGALIGLIVDVAESTLEIARSLRERESWLQLIVGQLPVIVWTTDTAMRTTSLGGTGVGPLNFGEPQEWIGRTIGEIADWSRMDPAAKLQVWAQLPERLQARLDLESAA